MRFVLANRNLVNFKQHPKHCGTGCPRGMYIYICAYSVGFVLLVLMLMAIPEPLFAEQQQCSPAFFMRVCELNL